MSYQKTRSGLEKYLLGLEINNNVDLKKIISMFSDTISYGDII
jgi:hypothetical protein